MRFRSLILLLLVGHVLVHPMVHALSSTAAPTRPTVSSLAGGTGTAASSLENCDLCRAGHSTMLWNALPQAERLNPQWISVRLQAVSYASLRAEHQLPARAPPSL